MTHPWRPTPAGSLTLAALCKKLGITAPARGGDLQLTDIKPLYAAEPDHLSFLDNQLYKHGARTTRAGAVLVREKDADQLPPEAVPVITPQPYVAFAAALQLFYPRNVPEPGQHQSALVAESARLHPSARVEPGVVIYPGAVIGPRAHIGANTVIWRGVEVGEATVVGPNCTLQKCTIGARCLIHPGVRIGQDGFGFAQAGDKILKVPQVGGVVIGDEVEIGANTTIDCGALDDTVIGDMVKIDNQVQIGHNVKIGKGSRIVAQTGIAGSAGIGEFCVIGGQVGIVGHIGIADKVMVAAQSGVTKPISDPGSVVAGAPAKPIREWRRETATLARLAKKSPFKDDDGDE
jgi:UDP-3-O-[3-hydroxymyristoyl] glucosamine N-acyltransferase